MEIKDGSDYFFFSKWRFIWFLLWNDVEGATWKIMTDERTGCIHAAKFFTVHDLRERLD